MGEAATAELRLARGAVVEAREPERASRAPPDARSALGLEAVRAGRALGDALTREERRRIVALVLCAPVADGVAASDAARWATGGLALGTAASMALAEPQGGVFAALHVAGSLVRGYPAGSVLIISLGGGGRGEASAALLVGAEGPTLCRPLAPLSRPAPDRREAGRTPGGGLRALLARDGVRPGEVERVASPGVSPQARTRMLRAAGLAGALPLSAEAGANASAAEVLAGAAQQPPGGPTLLWGCDAGGGLGGCLLAPGGGG